MERRPGQKGSQLLKCSKKSRGLGDPQPGLSIVDPLPCVSVDPGRTHTDLADRFVSKAATGVESQRMTFSKLAGRAWCLRQPGIRALGKLRQEN